MKGRAPRLALVVLLSVLLMLPPAQAQDILNCDDFASQAEAQESLREFPDDPDGLDGPPGEPSSGTPGLACEENPPPRDEELVPFRTPGGPPPPPPPPPPPEKADILLEAGGDLPLPQQSNTDNASGDDGRFPLWRIAGMILSTGVFAFAGYLVFYSRR